MRSKAEIISLLTNPGVIAVVRAQQPEQIIPLSEALIAGGVIAIEITMTTPNAIEAIRDARQKLGARGVIGVGTVLDVATCRAAVEAGSAAASHVGELVSSHVIPRPAEGLVAAYMP